MIRLIIKSPLSILSFFFLFALPSLAQGKQAPHPLYIANILIDDISVERMVQTCRFHDLIEIPSENGYTVFTDTKGNKLRFKKTDNKNCGVNGNLIELQTTDNIKKLEKILKEVGYNKQNNVYEKGSHLTSSHICCNISLKDKITTVTFIKVKNK